MKLIHLINLSGVSDYLGLKDNLRRSKPYRKKHIKKLDHLFLVLIPKMWREERKNLLKL